MEFQGPLFWSQDLQHSDSDSDYDVRPHDSGTQLNDDHRDVQHRGSDSTSNTDPRGSGA